MDIPNIKLCVYSENYAMECLKLLWSCFAMPCQVLKLCVKWILSSRCSSWRSLVLVFFFTFPNDFTVFHFSHSYYYTHTHSANQNIYGSFAGTLLMFSSHSTLYLITEIVISDEIHTVPYLMCANYEIFKIHKIIIYILHNNNSTHKLCVDIVIWL